MDDRFVEFYGILSSHAQGSQNFTIVQIECGARSYTFVALHHHGKVFS